MRRTTYHIWHNTIRTSINRKVKLSIILLLLGCALPLCAQETIFDHLERDIIGGGVVTIQQDESIKELVGKPKEKAEGKDKAYKVQGFRVQVYAGNNSQKARSEANRLAEKVRMLFPEMPVYIQFVSPRWLCRVGNYRTIEEADAAMRQLKATSEFKEISIVKSLIEL